MGERFSVKFVISAVLLLLSLLVMALWSAHYTGQTTDEAFFSASGYSMVRYNNYRFLGEQPPLLNQIGALPLLFLQPHFPINQPAFIGGSDVIDVAKNGAIFLYEMGNNPKVILFLQRLPIVALTVVLGFFVLRMGYILWGTVGGFFSLFFYAFDPNILSHGSLYTTDLGLTAFYFISIFSLMAFLKKPCYARAVLTGICCGLAFMSKISGLILFPVFLIFFVAHYFVNWEAQTDEISRSRAELALACISVFLLVHAICQKQAMVALGPICLFFTYLYLNGHVFKVIPQYLISITRIIFFILTCVALFFSYKLKRKYGLNISAVFIIWNVFALCFAVYLLRYSKHDLRLIHLTKFFLTIWIISGLVIVLGYTDFFVKAHHFTGFGHYVQPLGIVLSHSREGHRICTEGSFVSCDWRYFLGVIATKTPLLTLLSGLAGFVMLAFSRESLIRKFLILIPPFVFLIAAMVNGINIGLRHILPIYPFLFLGAGYFVYRAVYLKAGFLWMGLRSLLLVLCILFAVRTIKTGPDYLAYFNEAVGGVEQGAKLVADSNLNWGQDNMRLAEFVLANHIKSIRIGSEAVNAAIFDYAKINWETFFEKDCIDPRPGYYALGLIYYTNLQRLDNCWFKGRKPDYRIGKTIYVFKVPG